MTNSARITPLSRIAHLVDGAVDRMRQHGNAEQADRLAVFWRPAATAASYRSGGLVVLDRLAVEPDIRIWRKTPSMPSRSVSMMRRKDRTRSQR